MNRLSSCNTCFATFFAAIVLLCSGFLISSFFQVLRLILLLAAFTGGFAQTPIPGFTYPSNCAPPNKTTISPNCKIRLTLNLNLISSYLLNKSRSINGRFKTSAKGIDPRQAAQTVQADVGRYFLLFLNCRFLMG